MAKLFNVSVSGYYHCINADISQHDKKDKTLSDIIKKIFYDSRQTYGSRRIRQAMNNTGESVGIHRIRRLMLENGLEARRKKLFKTTTRINPKNMVSDNILEQDFSAIEPNQKWVSDISYIWTSSGWLYLAVIMDLFSRKIIGLAMAERMTQKLVMTALEQAITRRGKPKSCIYHSDRGSQYTAKLFQQQLKIYGLSSSMSGKGNCYDNSAMESFFATLKTEWVYHHQFHNIEEAKISIFDYVEIFYNKKRMHSYCGYLSPDVFEKQYYHL